jgi:hypothetical protein
MCRHEVVTLCCARGDVVSKTRVIGLSPVRPSAGAARRAALRGVQACAPSDSEIRLRTVAMVLGCAS